MNDSEREDWINNDEGLYNWQRSSGMSMRKFIRENREEIDRVINNVTSGKKQAHHLAYGPEAGQYPATPEPNPIPKRYRGRMGQDLRPR